MRDDQREKAYERSGRPDLPGWWTSIVFSLLRKQEDREGNHMDFAAVARIASEYAGRRSAWKGDAISKFISGAARTRELANGISHALGVAQPFFTARSENEAKAIEALMASSGSVAISPIQSGRMQAADEAVMQDRALRNDQTDLVVSEDERAAKHRRSRRTSRERS
jgi:hypothetical protein